MNGSPSTNTNIPPLALIVDDDLSLRLAMGAALTKAGFAVIEAENGRTALSLFQLKRPDIILLDVVMPEMDGYETCAAIRQLPGSEYVQIIMVTGMDDSESTMHAFEAGANDFIAKPINWIMLGHRGRYMLRASRAFQELTSSKNRLAKTQEIAKLGNWEIDLTTSTLHCSCEAGRLLGFHFDKDPVTLNEFLAPIVSCERDSVQQVIDEAVQLRKSFSINYRVSFPDGSQRYILNHGEILSSANGAPELLLGAVQDVSELRQAEEEIHRLAFYDGLTGLANRMLFLDRLTQEIASGKRGKQIFSLMFLDLDQFKRVNDSFGHHIGDLLLKAVSEILKKCIRSSDTGALFAKKHPESMIARIGGDEFTILLPDIRKSENAAIVAKRVIEELSITYNLEGHEVIMTTSIGISVFPADGKNPELLMKNADSAMYQAKVAGRNNYQFYDESLNKEVIQRFTLEQDMRMALKRDEFILYYQPQIELSTGNIVGAEALIRWRHPFKGMVPPDRFISVAEESGLIADINKWVIQTACRQCSEWSAAGHKEIRVAVNLSGFKFAKQNFPQVIKESLQAANLDPQNLEVEITENILMHDTEGTVAILQQIRDLQVAVSLDDFGTGYSSLSYLISFPVDTIKIDRSFVMGYASQKKNRIIIKAIIALGHSLGLKIVAEGIETEEQLEILKEYGCEEGQGYYFKRPVPLDEFMKALARNRSQGGF